MQLFVVTNQYYVKASRFPICIIAPTKTGRSSGSNPWEHPSIITISNVASRSLKAFPTAIAVVENATVLSLVANCFDFLDTEAEWELGRTMRSNRIALRSIVFSAFGLRACFETRRTHCGSNCPPAISSIFFSITLAHRRSVAQSEGASTKILTALSSWQCLQTSSWSST